MSEKTIEQSGHSGEGAV